MLEVLGRLRRWLVSGKKSSVFDSICMELECAEVEHFVVSIITSFYKDKKYGAYSC